MNKLYNTQTNIASNLNNFFISIDAKLSKPQLKLVFPIILGMIESESIVTTDIVKKLKGGFPKFNPVQTSGVWNVFSIILNLIFIIYIIL